jgi:UDP-2,3-diacylglucosamine pyrophosphatase LpxH
LKTFLVVPDIHCPSHDPKFIKLTLKIIDTLKQSKTAPLKGLVSLGDGLDFHQISTYDKDPSRRNTIGDDIIEYNHIINAWSSAMPRGSDMHFIQGNHELRLERYIARNAKDLFEVVRSLPELLRFPQRNGEGKHRWHWHPYSKWNSCKIGDCVLMHGFYYNQHVAMTNLAKYRTNVICGHVHRYQGVTDGVHYSYTLGHGSDEDQTAHQPTPTGWQQALGVLTLDNKGKTSLEVVLINNGEAVFRGSKIQAT